MISVSGKPTISVIIPVHYGGDNFRRCLQSMAAVDPSPDEIIVVADGDTDGSWKLAEEFGAKVLRTPRPQGPAHARNLGSRTAKGDILFFIDADVTVSRTAAGQITTFFRNNPDFVAVFGSYDDEPFETNFLSQYKNLFHHYTHQTSNSEASTFWAGCGAIRRDIFLKMGGFDEQYRRPSIEDIELGYRLKRAGYRIRLSKELKVKHLKRWSVFSLLRADFFYRALPWTHLIIKEGRFINDLNLKISNRISVILSCALLFTLLGAIYIPRLVIPAAVFSLALFVLNRDLYRFFNKKRGVSFALKSIPWHWFYFFYSGLAFSIGFAKYRIKIFFGKKSPE